MSNSDSEKALSDDFYLVAIGASAGGISAMQFLFSFLPIEANVCYVVVQHLLPDQPSHLSSFMSRITALPVHEIVDGMSPERGKVFVSPPGRTVTLSQNLFSVELFTQPAAQAGINTINRFFDSVASVYARRSIAVVLSDTGNDGAAGIIKVKQAGGTVLVQEPQSAMFDGMPKAAIATGGPTAYCPSKCLHVTEFFRDPAVWDTLQSDVIPNLIQESGGTPLRVWVAGCSTGEEAYSLAIVLSEQESEAGRPVDFQLFATDVSSQIVTQASRGMFEESTLKALSPERRRRFFYPSDDRFRVRRTLRDKMVFAPQDLLSDPPFAGLDLVTCRNLLI